MARPRKPDEIHILEGTHRADRHGDPAAEVVAEGEPTPPATLKGEARAFWDAVVPGLVASGVARQRDTAELVMMCDWWALYHRFKRMLARMPNGNKRLYQATIMVGIAQTNFDKLAARFGLSPADRAKLRAPANQAKDKGGVMSRKRG